MQTINQKLRINISKLMDALSILKEGNLLISLISKFFTYPLVAGSTFINLLLIQKILPLNEFNLALQFWMVIGSATLFEYTIGVGVTKTFSQKGNVKSAWGDFNRSLKLYATFGLVLTTVSTFLIFLIESNLNVININNVETHEFKHILMLTLWTVYLSGFSSLVMRVCIGLKLNYLFDLGRFFSVLITTTTLYFIHTAKPTLFVLCTVMSMNLFLPGFFAFILIGRINRKIQVKYSGKMTDLLNSENSEPAKHFEISYFFVACLYLLNFNLPRIVIDLETEKDDSAFLLILIVINTVFSIISSVSPHFWVDGVTKKLSQKLILGRYKIIFLITALAIPFYLFLIYLVFLMLLKVNIFMEFFTQAMLGLILLSFYSIHTVASNLLSRSVYQIKLLIFLLCQTVLTVISIRIGIFETSSSLVLLSLCVIHFLSILFPTAALLLTNRGE